jgi:hypothetical protein
MNCKKRTLIRFYGGAAAIFFLVSAFGSNMPGYPYIFLAVSMQCVAFSLKPKAFLPPYVRNQSMAPRMSMLQKFIFFGSAIVGFGPPLFYYFRFMSQII